MLQTDQPLVSNDTTDDLIIPLAQFHAEPDWDEEKNNFIKVLSLRKYYAKTHILVLIFCLKPKN
jgi:hypothetical protein